jgi:hypothetical protein
LARQNNLYSGATREPEYDGKELPSFSLRFLGEEKKIYVSGIL